MVSISIILTDEKKKKWAEYITKQTKGEKKDKRMKIHRCKNKHTF